ncbi:class I poly(R)-hydroxyalkanoic acid synthase [soil metagenome]
MNNNNAIAAVVVPPEIVTQLQAEYVEEATTLWNEAMVQSGTPRADSKLSLKDRRFAATDWQGNPASSYVAAMYLLNARTLTKLADNVETDAKTRQRIRFAVQQFVEMVSPSNYLALNPEAQRKAIETGGESITQGLQHLWHDVRQGHLSQTDESVFEVGRNVATSEGSVVFENDLFQLIEYAPLTESVHERALLIVPPCINKYYILDLQPENSLVRYAVSKGQRVFVMSWRNADDSMSQLDWDDYIGRGPIRAVKAVQDISGSKLLNTLGFCIGGTILANALSVLAARGEKPASSVTLLTAFLDFGDTGVLDIFVDEASVRLREVTIGTDSPAGGGILKGQELASTFAFLRPNDLVWNYVVGNYLKGETPPAFDLLYWNADSTNLPGPMYCTYLRNGYLENRMKQSGATTVCGVPMDFGRVDAPAYVYASREDHIVPWQSAYLNTSVLPGKVRFVLGASGHIAGVINSPTKNKRNYWVAPAAATKGRGGAADAAYPLAAAEWLAKATEVPGSWWTDWSGWLTPLSGKLVPAPRKAGSPQYKIIEPAPGRYVKEKAA